MTNAEAVREICRQIRGVALNYPDGLKEIRKQLDAVDANPAGRGGSTDVNLPPAGEVGQWRPTVTGNVIEATEIHVEKRRPGRPKGSKNRPKGAA